MAAHRHLGALKWDSNEVFMLTNIEILALRPRDKSYKVADGLGLYIQVQPTGSILWRFKYRFYGIERKLCFGSFPEVSLKEARALRDEARGKVAAGIDPSAVRRKAKLEAAMAASDTFRAIADEFIAKMEREGKSEATIKKANWFRDLLDRDIGHRPISEITPQELLHSIRRAEKRGHHETALRLRSFAGRVFRYAMATVRTDRNPSEVLRGAFTIPKTKHRSAIVEPGLVGELMRSISSYNGRPETRIALHIIAYTFVRPGELRFAEWSEFDIGARVWRIPGERMKMGLPHDVPLSHQVVAMVESLKAIGNRGRFLFPSSQSFLRPICENTLNYALRRMGYTNDQMTSHGFRALASTRLNEAKMWHPDAIERALAHRETNKVRAAYDRAMHWDERTRMMQWWSDYLDRLRDGSNINPAVVDHTQHSTLVPASSGSFTTLANFLMR